MASETETETDSSVDVCLSATSKLSIACYIAELHMKHTSHIQQAHTLLLVDVYMVLGIGRIIFRCELVGLAGCDSPQLAWQFISNKGDEKKAGNWKVRSRFIALVSILRMVQELGT